MAKVYRAPIDWVHDYSGSYEDWSKREQDYIDRIATLAKSNTPKDKLAGEIIQWGRGDGYAQYMIWSSRPLSLIHLEIGDAWHVEEPLLRGLRLSDVKNMVAAEQATRRLFAR